jgi:outer membrane protein
MKVIASLILTLMLAAPAAAQFEPDTAARPISLDEAIEMANRNAPSAVQARGQSETARAAVRSSWAAFIPTLSLSAGASRQLPSQGGTFIDQNGQQQTFGDEPWSYSTGLSTNLQLFDGGRRIYELRQARANADAARILESAQLFDVALLVKQQYFNVLAARESESAARSQLEQAEQQLKAASAKVRAGSGTKSDSLRSEIQRTNARLSVSEALNSLAVANASLTRVIGSEVPVTASGEDVPDAEALAISASDLERLADAAPEVKAAEAELTVARAARSIARSAYLPSLSAGYSYRGGAQGSDAFDYRGSLSLSVSLPIFDQLGRQEQSVRARIGEENATAALRDTRLAARENLARHLGGFRLAQERVAAQAASVEAAEEDLRVQQRRYDLGASTLLDLLTSQSQLNQARQALIQARYDQRVARAQIEALVGQSL